jgi:hypothetical protein
MLLSMMLAALVGAPALAPVAAAAAAEAPSRPTIEINIADTLRALPASSVSANGSILSDDGGPGGDTPILPAPVELLAAPFPAAAAFSLGSSAEPAQRRIAANQARAPPAA